MRRFGSVEEILDFAIARDAEANEFYTEMAERMQNEVMRKVFEQFAAEELGHKIKLEAVRAGEIALDAAQVASLGIADSLLSGRATPDMNYADALVPAMNREKASYRLYLELACAAEAEELTDLFLALAQEEAKHKLRFEIEYDDVILKED